MVARIFYALVSVVCLSSIFGCATTETNADQVVDGPTEITFSIFELRASENKFVIGGLIKNLSATPYAFAKNDAKLYFTPFDKWSYTANMDWTARNKIIVVTDVRVISWEDGESPALRIGPNQEKWIRVEGTLDGPSAKKFLDAKATHASIALFRLLNYGWGSSSSKPFVLHYSLGENLEQYCKQATSCR